MNAIKLAMRLLPLMDVLYEAGVIDISPGEKPYILLTAGLFKRLFPDVEPVGSSLCTVLDGITITAVIV